MKSIKINRLISSLAAVLLIFGAFFIVKAMEDKSENHLNVSVNQTWKFIGEEGDSPLNPMFYELDEFNTPCPSIHETVCKIEAPADPADPTRPNLDADVNLSPTTTKKVHERISEAINASPLQTNETVTGLRPFDL